MMPILRYVAILLLGLLLGIYIGSRSISPYADNNLEELAKLSDYSNEVYLRGNISASNIELLKFLDKLNLAIESNTSQTKALLLDKILVLGRLAVLASASGLHDAEKKYLSLAIAVCKQLKNKSCTETGVQEWVRRIDANQRIDKGARRPPGLKQPGTDHG